MLVKTTAQEHGAKLCMLPRASVTNLRLSYSFSGPGPVTSGVAWSALVNQPFPKGREPYPPPHSITFLFVLPFVYTILWLCIALQGSFDCCWMLSVFESIFAQRNSEFLICLSFSLNSRVVRGGNPRRPPSPPAAKSNQVRIPAEALGFVRCRPAVSGGGGQVSVRSQLCSLCVMSFQILFDFFFFFLAWTESRYLVPARVALGWT